MSVYNLWDLSYINGKIAKLYKDLKTHLVIFKDCGFTNEDVYKKGYVKYHQSEIKELKKKRKALLKERATLNAKLLSKNIHFYGDDGQSGVNYWVFHKGCEQSDILQYLELCYYVDIEGVQIHSMYDCTGQRFCGEVQIEEKDKVIVASQSWGYDV